MSTCIIPWISLLLAGQVNINLRLECISSPYAILTPEPYFFANAAENEYYSWLSGRTALLPESTLALAIR
jgi:hypothetical protein